MELALIAGGGAGLVALRWPLWLLWRRGSNGVDLEQGADQHGRLATPTFMLIVGTVAMAGVMGLSVVVLAAEQPTMLDAVVAEAVDPLRFPLLLAAFAWLTLLANTETMIGIVVAASVVLWVRGLPGAIVPVWVAFVGGKATTWALKVAIDRPRPEFLFDVVAYTPSFPSGHASGAISLFGILAVVAAQQQTDLRRRFEIVYWAAVLIAAVAFSRIYVGVHFATDVIAGLMVGAVWLLVAVALTGPTPQAALRALAHRDVSRVRERK